MIKYSKLVVLYTLFGIILFPTTLYADDVKQGKENYRRYCASCHGTTGLGDGPVADSLKQKPADLTQLSKRAGGTFPRQKIIKTIDGRLMPDSHGNAEMPVWGQWFAIQALVDGVRQENVTGIELEVNRRLQVLVLYLKTLQK
ncbi:MAG: c-type cytochrome [Rhodomicrobiaceae bacterium]